MLRYIVSKLWVFTVLPIAIYSYQRFAVSPIGSTAFWWIIQTFILMIFIAARYMYFESENKKNFLILDIFLIYIIFSMIRGIFMAENYWDYKVLITRIFELSMLLVAYVASNKDKLQSILSFYIKYALPIVFVIAVFQGMFRAKGLFLFPVGFLVIFLPGLKLHWKLILAGISLLVLIEGIALGNRSYIPKFGAPILLLLFYYFRHIFEANQFIKIAHKILMITPWILFFLGVSGVFNVFKFDEYLNINYTAEHTTAEGIVKKQDLTDDSRTFIYREVLQSAKKYNYWILGRSPSRGNETVAFAEVFEEISGRSERYKNEANVPNVFTWMGIVGVVLYFLVFYKASSLSIYKSNNIYSKILGLFIAVRWAYAWVEDYFTFGMNDFTIWLMIGLCLSESFRKMNNLEVKLWALGIFEKKFVKISSYITKDINSNYVKIKSANS